MAFSDLQMKVTSEFALQSLYAKLAPIKDFAHNFRDLEDRKGASIVIPVFNLSAAADFDADTNNYCNGQTEMDAATVNLSCHLVKQFMYTDRDVAETEVQWFKDVGYATGDAVGRGIYNTVIGLLNDTNVTLSAESSLSAKSDFAGLVDTVYAKNLDLGQTVLMLGPTYFANLLGTLDAYVYGGPEAIRGGYVPGLYGFKSVVCAPGLAEGWKGALVDINSIGIASRYLAPMAGAYVDAWKATDPTSGLTIGYRSFANLCTGRRYLDAECLIGAKVIRPTGIVSIK